MEKGVGDQEKNTTKYRGLHGRQIGRKIPDSIQTLSAQING